jgi:hypothetical protein
VGSLSSAHGKKPKFRRTGRHTAPSPVQKVAKRAGLAAPAVAVVGALAAAPHLYHHSATNDRVAAGAIFSDRVEHAAASDIARLQSDYRPHHPQAARPKPRHEAEKKVRPEIFIQHPTHHTHHAAPPVTAPIVKRPGRHAAPPTSSTAPHCSSSAGGMLPENFATIVDFLATHGYTGLAAAGIAGNIYQESGGNPESAGGLIGWTPLPGGYVTGNPAADLETQLGGLLKFNDQYPQDIVVLNAATSPVEAADIYMNDFERPGFPAAANREAAAEAVARACGL